MLYYPPMANKILTMEQALLEDLVQSLKEAKAIVRGESPASRRINVAGPGSERYASKSGFHKASLPIKEL